MRRILIIVSISAAGLVLGGWLLWGGASDTASGATEAVERRPPSVTVVRAARREIVEDVHISGTLVPREEVLVAPEVDNLAVTAILVEEGDRVAAGDVLARLSRSAVDAENAQAAASIAQAKAQIAESDASLVEARLALERAQSLVKSSTVSKSVYEQRLSAFQVAEARKTAAEENLKVAEAQKEQADIKLRRTEIKAPAAGVISRRTLRVGGIASMAAEPAFRIIEDGAIELEAEVVDATLARFATGQTVRVIAAGTTEALVGTIRLISPEVDATTRLGRMRVALPLDAKVSIGSFASGVVEIGRQVAITLPLSAVTATGGKNIVQVVKDNKVESREVELGLRSATRVEVKSGIAENEIVVARAGSFLRSGDEVTPIEANVETSDAGAAK